MHGIESGDAIEFQIAHQTHDTRDVVGIVSQCCTNHIRVDVESPPSLDVVTIDNSNTFNEEFTVYRGYSWVRIGCSEELTIHKYLSRAAKSV